MILRKAELFLLKAYATVKMLGPVGAACIALDLYFKRRDSIRKYIASGYELWLRGRWPDVEVSMSGLYFKEYESLRLKQPKVIVDAGANIRTSSIYFASKYPEALILAIEPEAGNYGLLCKNVPRFKNVKTLNAALWGEEGRRMIVDRGTGDQGYTTLDNCKSAKEECGEIDCITIAGLIQEFDLEEIDLLKMDIEGSEKNVLENSTDWIDRIRVMTVELHDRIEMGCDRAFYLATKDFTGFERSGEKVTAYRDSN